MSGGPNASAPDKPNPNSHHDKCQGSVANFLMEHDPPPEAAVKSDLGALWTEASLSDDPASDAPLPAPVFGLVGIVVAAFMDDE